MELKDCNIIEPHQDGRYNFRSSLKDSHGPHFHDFFEIFLVVRGFAVHNVNGERQRISDGSLVFVRPRDRHYYEQDTSRGGCGNAAGSAECQYINVAFKTSVAGILTEYFKGCFDFERLLQPPVSPCVTLPASEKTPFHFRWRSPSICSRSEHSRQELTQQR